jgi:geranylgeranyl diphosphate synthase type II
MPMALDEYLHDCREAVEAELERVLPAADHPPAVLHEAMRYSVFAGGKRIRPVFTIAAAECLGGRRHDALAAAAAVELLHTYTLIHDDLPCMDDDDFRRGRPSCHKAFGEANALLAGDALLTLAFETAAASPVAPAAVVRTLAAAAGSRGVVGGQVADLAATGQQPDEVTMRFIHEHKTADLFRAAIEMGALTADADAENLAALSAFGRATGLAFQMVDDLLDADNPDDQSFSCVHIMGVQRAKAHAATLTAEAMDALLPFGTAADTLRALARHLLERTS